MTETARVGWVVDVQNDFMRPDGRLYVKDLDDPDDPGAEEAAGRIAEAVEWMRSHCDVLVYTGDWHGYDDPEIDPEHPDPASGTYPPHCMGRSDDPHERAGAEIVEAVRPAAPVVLEVDADEAHARVAARTAVDESRPVFIRKTRFDVFAGNPATDVFLDALSWELGAEPAFYVAGVARDVCVTQAVDGLLDRGLSVVAIRDATWGLGLESEAATLERWRSRGARVVELSGLEG